MMADLVLLHDIMSRSYPAVTFKPSSPSSLLLGSGTTQPIYRHLTTAKTLTRSYGRTIQSIPFTTRPLTSPDPSSARAHACLPASTLCSVLHDILIQKVVSHVEKTSCICDWFVRLTVFRGVCSRKLGLNHMRL